MTAIISNPSLVPTQHDALPVAMCRHNEDWPADWCGDCRTKPGSGQRGGSSYALHDEEKVLAPTQLPFESFPAVYRTTDSINKLDRHATWVHLAGSVNRRSIERVLEHCRGLRLLQLPPNWRQHLPAAVVPMLSGRGIGFYYARIKASDIT